MIVTSVQIKTAKTQKHLYCLVFTEKGLAVASPFLIHCNGLLRQSIICFCFRQTKHLRLPLTG